MRVGERTDFNKLNLEIETDGTITPEEAFFKACDILIKHFDIISEAGALPKTETKKEIVVKKIKKIKKKKSNAKKK